MLLNNVPLLHRSGHEFVQVLYIATFEMMKQNYKTELTPPCSPGPVGSIILFNCLFKN